MVFSSPIFLFLFLPLTLLFYFLARNISLKNHTLLAASLLFYGWGESIFILVMLASIFFNYLFALYIDKNRNTAKIVLALAVTANLGILVFFKYANFIVNTVNSVLKGWFEVEPIHLTSIALPIGISFFTFQALSYVIDVYRQEVPSRKNLSEVALYIVLFPQLIAGPIIRYKDVAKQILIRDETLEKFSSGVKRFIVGLAKKVLIANTLGAVADKIFSIPALQLTTGLSWFGALAYTLQIYFDFSGYSDMAIGLGRMFGFEFLENFNYPYVSKSIREFWKRWHISLSTWFRDYLYIPLGGNRQRRPRVYFNLLAVFFLCGLWHGASWNFAVWGLFHGAFLIFERLKIGAFLKTIGATLRHVYTLLMIVTGWVIFRSDTLSYAMEYLKAMFGFAKGSGVEHSISMYATANVAVAFTIGAVGCLPVVPLFEKAKVRYAALSGRSLTSGASAAIFAVEFLFLVSALFASLASLARHTYNPFIYYRF